MRTSNLCSGKLSPLITIFVIINKLIVCLTVNKVESSVKKLEKFCDQNFTEQWGFFESLLLWLFENIYILLFLSSFFWLSICCHIRHDPERFTFSYYVDTQLLEHILFMRYGTLKYI
ncbi:MAG: hypothetical protein MHMPM18_004857, partial [Marteilia pararefringens]